MTEHIPNSGYVTVGELRMSYDRIGDGPPLVLFHGGLTTVALTSEATGGELAGHFETIGVEQQAHGHTADIDRALTFAQMADDTADLLPQLGVERADVLGYSDGGNVALGPAIRHPGLVRRLVVAGTNFDNDGLYPEILAHYDTASPDDMGPLADDYDAVSPTPGAFPILLDTTMRQAREFPGWARTDLRAITAPTLVIAGDADIVRPEHAVELFRLIPASQLAILSGTDHVNVMSDATWLLPTIVPFLVGPNADQNGATS